MKELIKKLDESGEKKENVLDGALLKCDKGELPTPLKVTSQNKIYEKDKLIATEKDSKVGLNILPFGMCSITQSACIPAIIGEWEKGSSTVTISNMKGLKLDSRCICTQGGEITILKNIGKLKIGR